MGEDGAATGTGGERLVVAVPDPSGQDPLAGELLATTLMDLGAAAVATVAVDGGPHLVADLPAGAVSGLAVPHRVLEPERSWTEGWREHARPHRAGRVVVRPPWCGAGPIDPGEVEVVVDPGAAFGSGSHPSTRGCLAALSALVGGGERVLDVGSGSGVLGAAALLLGAASLVAVDVDPAAVSATAAVVAANGVGERAEVSATPLADVPGTFDLVLANLLVPVVEELGAELAGHVGPGGRLVVGGLLVGHRDRSLTALAPLSEVSALVEDGWLTLVLGARSAGGPPGVGG